MSVASEHVRAGDAHTTPRVVVPVGPAVGVALDPLLHVAASFAGVDGPEATHVRIRRAIGTKE